MKQNRNRRQHRIALGLFCVFSLFATESYAAPAEIASRTPNVGGVQLHYLTAGKGPAVLLFHGYTQTSRLTMPVLSIGGDKSLGNELAAQMKLVAANVTVVVLNDTGHWILEEKPKETTDAIVKFL